MKRRTASWLGAAACAVAASLTIPFFNDTAVRTLVPFIFLAVIVFVAIRFGNIAGMLGTLAAALIFSIFLFKPIPSPFVENPAARNHLIWMVLIGIVSDLLGAYSSPGPQKRS